MRRRATSALLRPEQIEHFVTRGFLRLEGCLEPEEAARWVASVNRRIAEDPARWVKGYGPETPSLRGYDPDDASTWTWDYMDILGEQSFFIEDRAPRAWAAIGDLLGGHERVATWTWTDSAKPNFFPTKGGAEVVHPTDETWHIDDPRRDMTLEGLNHGLVCLVVLSSVGPGMGGTIICPDSLAPVARALARPEGYDFVDRQAGAGITRDCQEFVEATGEAGDVYFLHPLVMHSVAPNPSGKIRWISNPLIHLRQPLVFDAAEAASLSPVERAITEALGPKR